MFPSSSFDSLFPEDFFGYRYPENFHSRREIGNVRAKRNAQQKVLQEKKLLNNALERGDSEEASILARQLAGSKQKLLSLSRSISSEQIADDADKTIKTAQRHNLMNSQNQLSNLTISKKPGSNKKKIQQNDNKPAKTMKSEAGTRRHIPVIDEEAGNEESPKQQEKSKEKERERVSESESESESEREKASEEERDRDREKEKVEIESQEEVNEHAMNLDEVKVDEEKKSKEQVEEICSNTREALEKSKKFHERAIYLVDELQKFKKEFYEIDGTIMDTILKLDRITPKGEGKEMRKKAIAYYTQALKDLDESVKPLNEFELNFKSQV